MFKVAKRLGGPEDKDEDAIMGGAGAEKRHKKTEMKLGAGAAPK